MTRKVKTLNDCLEVGARFRRSVNLEKDYVSTEQNGDYIVTPTAREALRRLSDSLTGNSPYRAWTLTGPYGVGKSAFAVFLTRLLCSADEQGHVAREQLAQADPQLSLDLAKLGVWPDSSKGMLPITITARRTPAPICLAEGFTSAATSTKPQQLKTAARQLRKLLNDRRNGDIPDTREVTNGLSVLGMAARKAGYSGLLLIVDELR